MALPSLWTNRPTVHFIFVIVNKGPTRKCVGQKKSVTIVKFNKRKEKNPKATQVKKKKTTGDRNKTKK